MLECFSTYIGIHDLAPDSFLLQTQPIAPTVTKCSDSPCASSGPEAKVTMYMDSSSQTWLSLSPQRSFLHFYQLWETLLATKLNWKWGIQFLACFKSKTTYHIQEWKKWWFLCVFLKTNYVSNRDVQPHKQKWHTRNKRFFLLPSWRKVNWNVGCSTWDKESDFNQVLY